MNKPESDIVDRITEYLSVGGFFNPEHMEHDRVKNLLLDCRNEITEYQQTISKINEYKQRLAEYTHRWKQQGLSEEQIKKLLEPLESFYMGIVEEVETKNSMETDSLVKDKVWRKHE